MLNKYYARTDECSVYRIAMGTFFSICSFNLSLNNHYFIVLHPRHKTVYFSKAGWLREWIDEAKRLTCQEWIRNYKPEVVNERLEREKPEKTSSVCHFQSCILVADSGIKFCL